MRRTMAAAGLALGVTFSLLACAPPGSGSGVQESRKPSPEQEPVEEQACFIGPWEIDPQEYAAVSVEWAAALGQPITDPLGSGYRSLIIYPDGLISLVTMDLAISATIQIPTGGTVDVTTITSEHWTADWQISDDGYFDIGPREIISRDVETGVADGGVYPGEPFAPPDEFASGNVGINCNGDVMIIDGPAFSTTWYRGDGEI